MRFRTLLLLLVTVVLVFAGASQAFALAPHTSPVNVIPTQGFESTLPSYITIKPWYPVYTPTAWWGPIGFIHHSGTKALWCAGSKAPAAWPSTYPLGSGGDTVFALPQLADYYSSTLSFYYSMPSLGDDDEIAFVVTWADRNDTSIVVRKYGALNLPLTAEGAWRSVSWTMAPSSGAYDLSRRPVNVGFQWYDAAEAAGQTHLSGEGPSIDDVSVTGYMYGPIRSLSASRTGNSVTLKWAAPYAATNSTSVDTRTISYHVFRSPDSDPAVWTDLGGTTSTTWTDPQTYRSARYFVQAFNGAGTAWGDPSGSRITAPGIPGFAVTYEPVQGSDRYGTAIAAVERAFPTGADTVVLAYGGRFPDALGGSALCGAWNAPLLLTQTDYIPQTVVDEISKLKPTHAIILGSTSSVSAGVESQLAKLLPGGAGAIDRIGGDDRYDTASQVAVATMAKIGSASVDDVFLAVGDNFPDALAASPAAYAKRWPILLTQRTMLSLKTKSALSTLKPKRVHILGSTGAVPQLVEDQLKAAYPSITVDRWMGADRYATSAEIARRSGLSYGGIALATGEKFPDALAGGVMQGKLGGSVLLTRSLSLSAPTSAALSAHQPEIGWVRYLGSNATVSDAVRASVATVLH